MSHDMSATRDATATQQRASHEAANARCMRTYASTNEASRLTAIDMQERAAGLYERARLLMGMEA